MCVGGRGTITPLEASLSIAVVQTQEVHEEITDLLEQLRYLQRLKVAMTIRFLSVPDRAMPAAINVHDTTLTAQQIDLFTAAASQCDDPDFAVRRFTLQNGQSARLSIPPKGPADTAITIQPVISNDRRFVRISFVGTNQIDSESVADTATLVVELREANPGRPMRSLPRSTS